jgi:hypothetical protein
MKQATQTRAAAQPQMWCEDCCVRIAPYEDFVTHKKRNLHRECFQKAQLRPPTQTLTSTDLEALLV